MVLFHEEGASHPDALLVGDAWVQGLNINSHEEGVRRDLDSLNMFEKVGSVPNIRW